MPTTLRIVTPKPAFDVDRFLRSPSVGTTVATHRPGDLIFLQGDASNSVMYLREGVVKLSVLARSGKEAVVAMVETGAFFGESALVVGSDRHQAATSLTASTVLIIPTDQMIRLLHDQQAFADHFMAYVLARNIRIEEDVVDQLVNACDKRLARVLLLLAHSPGPGATGRVLPAGISQQTLADMVGTTRPRVNFFLNRFRKRGYIEYRDGITINDSLVTLVLQDERIRTRRSKAG